MADLSSKIVKNLMNELETDYREGRYADFIRKTNFFLPITNAVGIRIPDRFNEMRRDAYEREIKRTLKLLRDSVNKNRVKEDIFFGERLVTAENYAMQIGRPLPPEFQEWKARYFPPI